MPVEQIIIPDQVFEHSLFGFIQLLGTANDVEHIIVDFKNVHYYVPSAIVALLVKFHKWLSEGKKVSIINYQNCSAYTYLQRIDFFNNCGIILEEHFERHSHVGRFVPISRIPHNPDELATEIAKCIEPVLAESDDIEITGPFDYLEYSISELGTNTNQHSQGIGFACAQYTSSSDYIRVAMADTGIGIKNSFIENDSSHIDPWMNDNDAIKVALKPEISSKKHLHIWGESPNMGVGLSLLWDTILKMNGTFIIVSGSGYVTTEYNTTLNNTCEFNGTLCTFVFKRQKLSNFYDILNESKCDLGLIKTEQVNDDLFI